ncbi:hypothetical protein H072_8834 [Dactylellina haptotyla CBS 200.50]|uniref:Uncharacterized protein n=1 Tax=Dactylellina haptotyla (strain CBS 200.50) TaxID=1284197 RepID=S8A397_DACHA|nr:hypothetical protein H072_8834 [Dactylellina haptotyla CBS 200.50]
MVVFIDLDADTVERDFPGHSPFYYNHFADDLAHAAPSSLHAHIPHYARPAPGNTSSARDSTSSAANSSLSPTRPTSSRAKASTRRSNGHKGKDRAPFLSNPNDTERLNKLFRVVGIYPYVTHLPSPPACHPSNSTPTFRWGTPCIRSVAQHLDRTDLYNLSSTCRDMHQCLLENRRHLLPFTLRCQVGSSNVKRLIASIRSPVVRTQCVSDLVNICDRCRRPSCRNCKTRSTKPTGQSNKRATCRACSSVSLATLTEDPTIKPCNCQSKGEPWVCNGCAVVGMENYVLKTNKSGRGQIATVELECGRGTTCVGKGWYTCENFYAYLDNSGKEEKFAKRGEKVRYACKGCKQFIFSKEEVREFLALRS